MAEREDAVARIVTSSAPFLIGIFGILLLALPVRLFGGLVPTPIFPLIIVYFWSIHDPWKLPSSLVFALGLMQDALTGVPFGLWSTVYLVLQLIIQTQRSYFFGREPAVIWLGFVVAAFGAGFMVWALSSLVARTVLPVEGVVFQILVTVAVYPVLSEAFRNLRHRVLQEV